MLQCGMVLFISVVRLSRKKVKFVLRSCEFGSSQNIRLSDIHCTGGKENKGRFKALTWMERGCYVG